MALSVSRERKPRYNTKAFWLPYLPQASSNRSLRSEGLAIDSFEVGRQPILSNMASVSVNCWMRPFLNFDLRPLPLGMPISSSHL